MSKTSYIIHLPTGQKIPARDGKNLDELLALNVCRVYQASQLRIEPIFAARVAGLSNAQITRKITEFERTLVGDSLGDPE